MAPQVRRTLGGWAKRVQGPFNLEKEMKGATTEEARAGKSEDNSSSKMRENHSERWKF